MMSASTERATLRARTYASGNKRIDSDTLLHRNYRRQAFWQNAAGYPLARITYPQSRLK
jgi:hypothetical protein